MIRLKVEDIIERRASDIDLGFHNLYVIREGETVFYVGISKRDVIDRLYQHLGMPSMFNPPPDALGMFILEHRPDSLSWDVELLKRSEALVGSEAKKVIDNWMTCQKIGNPEQNYIWDSEVWYENEFNLTEAEIYLIRKFNPCLNKTYNDNPSPLPDKYSLVPGHNQVKPISNQPVDEGIVCVEIEDLDALLDEILQISATRQGYDPDDWFE